jgi:UDPglucose 6-dehydrogenase
LSFTTDTETLIKESYVIFIAVGTPSKADGSADLSGVYSVAATIGKAINDYKIIVTKSTVPIGTTHKVKKIISDLTSVEFDVVSNPEFLKEGAAVSDFMRPDRVILGCESEKAKQVMTQLYAPFTRTGNPIIVTDIKSSEMIKYGSNAMLAVRISFMNDMAKLCEKVGADVEKVRKGMGADSRIGPKFLYPGIGYGGSCFPKDISAILYLSRQKDSKLSIIEATHEINENQKRLMVDKMEALFGDLKGLTVAILGLSFKPNTDDVREAPAHIIVNSLLAKGAKVRCYDPVATENFKKTHPEGEALVYCNGLYDAVTGADAACLCTEWHELQRPDFAKIKELMNGNALFDGRNVWNSSDIKTLGFRYEGVGRPIIEGESK